MPQLLFIAYAFNIILSMSAGSRLLYPYYNTLGILIWCYYAICAIILEVSDGLVLQWGISTVVAVCLASVNSRSTELQERKMFSLIHLELTLKGIVGE
jgi:hypothetical protein